MYQIFIKNYLANGVFSAGETSLYSIPISELDASYENVLIDPVVKTEIGKTGTLEFSMQVNHPYYNSLIQMRTIMRVVYDGDTLFRGRVLTVDTSPLTGERKVHLEGDMAFLMDSYQPGIKEEERPEVSALVYLQSVLQIHNDQMIEEGSDDKKIYLGEVPGQYSVTINNTQKVVVSENHKFGSNSWVQSMNALEGLSKEYGGYFRTRWDSSSGKCYLDWLDNCFNFLENAQPIELGANLIDIRGSTEVDNIFTALIPIGRSEGEEIYIEGYREDIHGHNKRILVPQIVGLFTDSELNRGPHSKQDYLNAVNSYGIVYKTQQFSNADTQDKLWAYAIDWIKNNYVGGITSFDISALDLHHIDGQVPKYLYGDRVRIIYPDMSVHTEGNTPTIEKVLTIMNAQYYLHNPEKNSYGIGTPNLLLSKEYGTSTSNSGSGGSASKGVGNNNNNTGDEYEELRRSVQEMDALAWRYVANNRYHNDIYAQLQAEDPRKGNAAMHFTHIMLTEGLLAEEDRPTSGVHKKRFQKMWIDGINNTFEMAGPIDQTMQFTDEQIDQLNQVNRVISFNALKQEFGMRQAINITAGSFPDKTPSDKLLMKVGLVKSSSGALVQPQGSIEIWNQYRDQNENAKPSLSLFGDGTLKNVTQFTGKGTAGADPSDEPTIIQNGLTGITQLFDPSTVGLPNVTPVQTVEQNGSDGSVSAGAGGSLDGWKVTLNKPLTYTATDPTTGVTNTYNVSAGSVAATDFHFTAKYDSLYSKLIVTDQLITDRATINMLNAVKADIDVITSDAITVGTKLSAETARLGTSYIGTIYHTSSNGMGTANLFDAIWTSFKFTPDNDTGAIKLQGVKFEGTSWEDLASFNIAATQKYITDVAAARNAGGASARAVASMLTGSDVVAQPDTTWSLNTQYKVYPTYIDASGQTQRGTGWIVQIPAAPAPSIGTWGRSGPDAKLSTKYDNGRTIKSTISVYVNGSQESHEFDFGNLHLASSTYSGYVRILFDQTVLGHFKLP